MFFKHIVYNSFYLLVGVNILAKYEIMQPGDEFYWMAFDFMRPGFELSEEEKRRIRVNAERRERYNSRFYEGGCGCHCGCHGNEERRDSRE